MDSWRMRELLAPYLGEEPLSPTQAGQIVEYLALLQKWNAAMNLTAVRDPEEVVTRHFGESLFTARQLFPDPQAQATVADLGSGAGFPGLPIAIVRPHVFVSLIESHGKKATFLREVKRTLAVKNAVVANIRAEGFAGLTDVVLFRAVEHFEAILPIAARLVNPDGRLAALIGASQVADANRLIGESWSSDPPVYFPDSPLRVLWIAKHR
jgi:16S rRNA (guanine527-N7)-methyltransferase